MNHLNNPSVATRLVSPERPPAQIGIQIDYLEKQVDELRCLTGDLESRLGPALLDRPKISVSGADPAAPEEYLVPHADRIRSIRKMAECLTSQLQSILGRLEV